MKAIDKLKKMNRDQGYGEDIDSIIELLDCGKVLHRKEFDRRRWYTVHEVVSEVNGLYFRWYDQSSHNENYEPEYNEDEIAEVKPVEKTIVVKEWVKVEDE